MLHAAWDAARTVVWGLTWALYAVYVVAALAMALALVALVVTTILAAIPGRAGAPEPEGRDARP